MKISEEIIFPKHISLLEGVNKFKDNALKPIRSINYSYLDKTKTQVKKNNLREIKDSTERTVIINALQSSGGDNLEAAKKLGISLRSFYYKIKKFNIKKKYEYN